MVGVPGVIFNVDFTGGGLAYGFVVSALQDCGLRGEVAAGDTVKDLGLYHARADRPATIARPDRPAIIVRADRPATIVRADSPVTIVRADRPDTIARADRPVTIARADRHPKTKRVEFYSIATISNNYIIK